MATNSQIKLKTYDRVEHNGVCGTVKYVGNVNGADGIWIGVDWDSPEKGKNDGSHGGQRYFDARCPTSGSFVRPEKLNLGITFVDALYSRYEDNMSVPSDSLLNLPQPGGVAKQIELVGFEKVSNIQKNLNQLPVVELRNLCISSAGPVHTLPSLEATTFLDIQNNLLSSWSEVVKILSCLPSVSSLILTGNRIAFGTLKTVDDIKLPNVKTFVFGKSGYNWSEILALVDQLFPNLMELDVWNNGITALSMPPLNVFQTLRSLVLSENDIKSWSQVCLLGHLPLLTSLQICSCGISKVEFDTHSTDGAVSIFPKLTSLNLSDNLIADWVSISNLNRLSALEDLIIRKNPVFANLEPAVAFSFVVGRISGLKKLNRMEVGPKERKEAELFYVRHFYKEWKSCEDKQKFLLEHPLYLEHIKNYGEPLELLVDPAVERRKKFLELCFRLETGEEVRKKLSKTMSIAAVKVLVKRLFKLDSTQDVVLTLMPTHEKDTMYSLDDDMQTLGFYALEDGDLIAVK